MNSLVTNWGTDKHTFKNLQFIYFSPMSRADNKRSIEL